MSLLKQSSTDQPLVFLMVDSTDHVTGKTGLSPTVTLSKAGGSFNACAGAVTEIANGWYKVAGNATDTGTLGPLALHAAATGADPVDILYEVVAFDPQNAVRLGLTALPNAAAAAENGLPTTNGTKLNQTADLTAGQSIAASSIGSGGITSASFAADAIAAAAIKADAVTKIQNGLATPTNITGGTITTVTNLTNAPTTGDLTAAMKASVATAVWSAGARTLTSFGTLVADVAAAVWAIATSGLTAAGSIGKYLLDHIIGILATGTHTAQSGDSYAVVNNGTYGNPALQTLMADVPTNSELSTALAGADDAVLSAIAALNNLSSAGAQAAAAAALAAYGAATGTNVTDATSPLATSSQAETISQAIDALNDLSTTDVQAIIDAIKGSGWTNETLKAIKDAVDAIETGGAPTAEQNAQAVWDEAKSGHTTEGTFGAYLDMPISEIGTGSGAVTFTYTVLEPDGITPISGVTVQVSTDLAGTNRIRSGMTDADGKVVFKMDPGERHFWRYKDGYQFDNPDTEIVSED